VWCDLMDLGGKSDCRQLPMVTNISKVQVHLYTQAGKSIC
jgi:hypothetical protein